jgi:outer membrane receptor protein involved in Fe transport
MRFLRLAAVALLAISLVPGTTSPQERDQAAATVSGRIRVAETEEPVEGAFVRIEGTNLVTLSDSAGLYRIAGVPAGPQVLRVERLGFATARIRITFPTAGLITQDVELSWTALEMEGITVTADATGRARGELGTASVIEQEAIEHQTATSLAGVLELVPGIELQPPGLDNLQQIALRIAPLSGSEGSGFLPTGSGPSATDAASFGTAVIMDGVPLSNNANVQTVGWRGSSAMLFTSSASGGIDLRAVPANTIERVEVIRGVPSARYGDLTQGAIIVDSRAAEVPPIIALKADPRTLEGSVVGGRRLGNTHTATLTFDIARSRTQPGLTDDEMTRLTGQFAHRLRVGWVPTRAGGTDRLVLDTRVDFYQLVDDRPENPNTAPGLAGRARDRGLRLTERARYLFSENAGLYFTGGLATDKQDSYSRRPRVSGVQPFTDRLTEGRSEGWYIGGEYTSEQTVDGQPWLGFARLEAESRRAWLGFGHELRGGLELRREWNDGPGYQFDMAFPPYVSWNGVNGYDRPRSYDEMLPIVASAFYLDDRMSRRVFGDAVLNLQAGLRLDLLHDGGSWFSGVRDQVLQPRLNLEFMPRPWLRLRGGWGKTAKIPPLGLLFPGPQYFDLVNVNWYTEDPAERLAVLTTFIKDPTNPELGFAVAEKREVGLELEVGGATVSLVGFRDRIERGLGIRGQPDFVLRDHYQLTDSTIGNGQPPEIIEPPFLTDTVPVLVDFPDNIYTITSRGLELIASLPELRPLRTRLEVIGSWVKTKKESDNLYFSTQQDFTDFQLMGHIPRTPYWEGVTETGEQALVHYRLIHHQPALGLVITATIQHNVTTALEDLAGTDTLAFAGYMTRAGELVPVPESERANPEYADLRQPRKGTLKNPKAAPADWLLSIQVSKTLPAEGQLRFWAYNLLDKRGSFPDEPDALGRPYQPMRFGLEFRLPTRTFLKW